MKKAIFLDRDGVINKRRDDYVKSIGELEIFPFVAEAIKDFHLNDFLVIIITNQSAINRNLTTHEKVKQIHHEIQLHLKKKNTCIDGFYYCPHRPDENCMCRKPKLDLLFNAIKDFNIDPKNSWFIGDSEIDIEAGKSMGCSVIKINEDVNLIKAVKIVVNQNCSNKHS